MQIFKKKDDSIDEEIARVISKMSYCNPETEEYGMMAKHLELLNKSRSYKPGNKISGESWLVAGTAISQIVMILWHEKAGVIASKAVSFVFKGRFS